MSLPGTSAATSSPADDEWTRTSAAARPGDERDRVLRVRADHVDEGHAELDRAGGVGRAQPLHEVAAVVVALGVLARGGGPRRGVDLPADGLEVQRGDAARYPGEGREQMVGE